jgi:hypothetical protein
MSSPKNEENTLASTISNNVVPLPQQVTRAEVFFDYTAILTDKDENEWLILGNLCIKNTGNKVLRNPQVLLRLTPSNALNLGGQILPPNVVDTLGVQSSEGSKGWMYLDEDWLKKGHEKGEYRIGPIQPLEILPEEMEMHSLQISIIKSRVRGAVTVEGFVYFEEQGYQCIANNRIALSF